MITVWRVLGALLLAAAALSAVPAAAQSGCYYEGQLYPEGTRVGGLVCVNGQWVPG
jgi:hypothetical protein